MNHASSGGIEPRVVSAWSIDTLYVHFSRVIVDLETKLLGDIVSIEKYAAASVVSSEHTAAAAVASSEKAIKTALDASKEAIIKAEVATEKRFESVNEFRKTLADASALFMPRNESDAKHETLLAKVLALGETMGERINTTVLSVSRIEARSQGASALWGYLVGAAGLMIGLIGCAIAVVTFLLTHSSKS